MLLTFATLAVLAFCISIGVVGVALLWRGWRIVGGVLLAQALVLTAALVALSTVPFGIGEPLIRVPFRAMLVQTLGTAAAFGGVVALVYLIARMIGGIPTKEGARLPQGNRRRLGVVGLLIAIP